jgi:membrane fusion protein (multidrug efflux system)
LVRVRENSTVKKISLTVIVALAIAVAIGAAHWYINLRPAPEGASTGAGGRPATPVETAEVRVDLVSDEVSAVGTLRSNESVIVRPEIAGRISAIHITEGEPVEKGETLVSLDDSTHQAELADARASLNLAERTFKRLDELFDKGSTSARERDEALARLESARAALELSQARLAKTDVKAPFSGILGLRRVSPGDYVTPGQDMVNLEDIDPIKVDFRIPERFLSSLSTGQSIRVRVDAFPERAFKGEVYAIDPQVDPAGRSIAIRARIDNLDRVLRPGLFARVRLIVDLRPDALVIPEQALVPRGEQRYVFRVVDGKAVLTEVRIGQRREGEVEIVAGLSQGETVIIAGQLKIRDGSEVTILDGEAPAGGDA